jgi:hypothetical protein
LAGGKPRTAPGAGADAGRGRGLDAIEKGRWLTDRTLHRALTQTAFCPDRKEGQPRSTSGRRERSTVRHRGQTRRQIRSPFPMWDYPASLGGERGVDNGMPPSAVGYGSPSARSAGDLTSVARSATRLMPPRHQQGRDWPLCPWRPPANTPARCRTDLATKLSLRVRPKSDRRRTRLVLPSNGGGAGRALLTVRQAVRHSNLSLTHFLLRAARRTRSTKFRTTAEGSPRRSARFKIASGRSLGIRRR